MYDWRTGRSCVYKNQMHLVFVAKYRKSVFTLAMGERLREVFSETCIQMQCELMEYSVEEDHVHLMVQVHPKVAVSNLVGKLKGKSSYVLPFITTVILEVFYRQSQIGYREIGYRLMAGFLPYKAKKCSFQQR